MGCLLSSWVRAESLSKNNLPLPGPCFCSTVYPQLSESTKTLLGGSGEISLVICQITSADYHRRNEMFKKRPIFRFLTMSHRFQSKTISFPFFFFWNFSSCEMHFLRKYKARVARKMCFDSRFHSLCWGTIYLGPMDPVEDCYSGTKLDIIDTWKRLATL